MIPIWGRDEAGNRVLVDRDQCVRPDASLEALAALKPAFLPGRRHRDGRQQFAAERRGRGTADHVGRKGGRAWAEAAGPRAGHGGRRRRRGGDGHRPRAGHAQGAVQRAGLKLADIDLIELNEAFAAQALACIRMLGLDQEKVNVRGGAIAIGHPLGASGARIATTLINDMIDRGARLGLATMCIGVGQGIATIFERV